jgi:hypothetical protein
MKRFDFNFNFKKFKRPTFDEKVAKSKQDLFGWLNSHFGSRKKIDWQQFVVSEGYQPQKMREVGDTRPKDPQEWNIRLQIYLGEHRYNIGAHIYEDGFNKKDYLGAMYVSTRWLRGEETHRGNDINDGDFSKETLDGIVRDILSVEFLELETRDRDLVSPPEVLQQVLDVLDGNTPQEPEPPQLERRWI